MIRDGFIPDPDFPPFRIQEIKKTEPQILEPDSPASLQELTYIRYTGKTMMLECLTHLSEVDDGRRILSRQNLRHRTEDKAERDPSLLLDVRIVRYGVHRGPDKPRT